MGELIDIEKIITKQEKNIDTEIERQFKSYKYISDKQDAIDSIASSLSIIAFMEMIKK